MAYEPGQPWDKTMSYEYGQTCTYNGYYYVFWRPDANSTVGVEPNKEEALFTASAADGSGQTDQRLERCWVLYVADPTGYYQGVKPLQASVRGLPYKGWETINYAYYYGSVYHGYWSPRGQKSEFSWNFYGHQGMSCELGLPNNDDPDNPIPMYDGNGNIVFGSYSTAFENYGPINSSGNIPYLLQLAPDPPPDPPAERTYYFDLAFLFNGFYGEARLDTYNCFNRTAHYTIKYKIMSSDGTIVEHVMEDTASTGDVRDNFTDVSTYERKHYAITWAEGESFAGLQIIFNDITPRFDA